MNTLSRADKAMRTAISTANELCVPLIVAGDLHDTKANLRGECVKAILDTISLCKITPYILVGNHCKINEKSKDHALEFLRAEAIIVDSPMDMPLTGSHGIPYYSNVEELHAYLESLHKGARLIMHQGVMGSEAGHYIQDKSACPKEWFSDYRVISGHYHKRQDIKCGRLRKGGVGLLTYLGNPYTLNFGEANDPAKGYHILNDDGSLDFVELDLPRHVIVELEVQATESDEYKASLAIPGISGKDYRKNDFVWVKVTGPKELLIKYDKKELAKILKIDPNFKIDYIPLETKADIDIKSTSQDKSVILDKLIDSLTNVDDKQKKRLKSTWKDFT